MTEVEQVQFLPHSLQAEEAVLGSLLLSTAAFALVCGELQTTDFFRVSHRSIYAAIGALHRQRQAVDVVTVSDFLQRTSGSNEDFGVAYIGRLASNTPSAHNIEAYAKVVRDRSILRRLKQIGESIAKAAITTSERTPAELVAAAQESLQKIQAGARTGSGLVSSNQLIRDLLDDLDRRSEAPTGLKIGLSDFDGLTCGLEAGDLVVVAARPGVGKTAFLVSAAATVSGAVGVAVFSAEMPSHQLMRRSLALQAAIPQGLLRRAAMLTEHQWTQIGDAAGTVAGKMLWIDDTAAPTLAHIRAETLSLKAREPLGLVFVDYVQLVRGAGSNRYEQLRDVAYGLKALAKESGLPIIVLAQLNREVEKRDQRRPSVSDLRDSGAIEEAADIVGLLYSESHYDKDFPMPYVLECNIAKNRNGERGECLWRFDAACSRILTLDAGSAAEYQGLIHKKPRNRDF